MDREATVIRAEMSRTRSELGRKIDLLEARARQFDPRQLTRVYMPEYALDRAIGSVLTFVGLTMIWSHWRSGRRLSRVRVALESYGRP